MRIIRLGDVPRRRIDEHGSKGFDIGALGLTAEAHLVVARLDAGGIIGRHPAAGRQLLIVVEGDARVRGDDGDVVDLGPGETAVWEPGELHETRSLAGLVAFIVEGDVDLGTPGREVDPGDI